MKKNGREYQVLLHLERRTISDYEGTRISGLYDVSALLAGSNGALYGTSKEGGDDNLGTVFRYGHALCVTPESRGARVSLTGIPGYRYQLERSTNLIHWTTVKSFTMPTNALADHLDTNVSSTNAFFRLRVR